MPIYEYECIDCSHKFELIQKMAAALSSPCPKCKNGTAERLISSAGFQLKGSGWYAPSSHGEHLDDN